MLGALGGVAVTLFADVVATSQRVAATPSRTAKVAALVDLLRRLEPSEVEATVAFLSGEPRQGRIGVGWATVSAAGTTHAAEPSITIGDVDRTISLLQATIGAGSVATRSAALVNLFSRATEDEAKFIGALLTGGVRQGALEGVMVDAVAKAASLPLAAVRRAAMLAGNLCEVAAIALTAGADGLAAVTLRPMHPVLPMLAASSPDVSSALELTGEASVEWKLDGARIQVHRDGDDVRIFTRNLNDITERLPSIVAAVKAMPATCLILDGEAMWWAEEEAGATPERFQEMMSRFGSHAGSDQLAARFFDILHLDGEDLLDRPLTGRQVALGRVVGPWRIPSILTTDPQEAAAFSDAAVAAGHEGVMVKTATSPYDAGRRGGAWRKVKPVKTFDLVVLAAEWGHGRRQGWLSNLHLGALGPEGEPVMVGKTFKGLTDDLLAWQTAEFLARETGRSGITVYVRPELVVEIALDGVQSSTRYPGGIALRFARVKRYRPDKSPAEADSLESLRERELL
ncbi:MAG: ATP-dependent DNA ligase [Acidimicrobiales bacterium]